jgi:lysophospholipase L1-like esterase
MSALDFGARGMARGAGIAQRRSGLVGRALRAAQIASAGNPVIAPVVASGGGVVTVAQSAAAPGGVADIGNIAAMIAPGTLPMRVFGGDPQTPFGTTVRGALPRTGGGGGYFAPRFECMLEGTQICFKLDSAANFRVIADNAYVGSGGVPTLFNISAGVHVLVTFAAAGVHRVGVERLGNGAVDALLKPTASQIWKPDPAPVRALVIGDSYSAGSGASFEQNSWARQMGLRLGWDVVINAQGGTGHANPSGTGGFSIFGSADRMNYVTAQPYDAVIVAGGINDATAAYAPQVAANALAHFQAIRAAQPHAVILALGAWAGSTGPGTGSNSVTAVEQSVQAAASATGDPMCRFVPVSTGARPWIFGTGKVGATNGSGNSDIYIGADGTHPPDAGHAYLARRAADAVVATLEAMVFAS